MNNAVLSSTASNVNWLLRQFATNTTGVAHAIAVSSDGLLMAVSSDMDRSNADRLAAIITGMRSLADGSSRLLNAGPVQQVIIELGSAFFFVASISGGSALGVVASKDSDLGHVGYEIALLVDRVGPQLTPELITELKNNLGGL
jgi:uncharacterized protein